MKTTKMRMIAIVAKSCLDSEVFSRLRELGVPERTIVRSHASAPLPHSSDGLVGGYTLTEATASEHVAEKIVEELREWLLGDPSVVYFVSDLPPHEPNGRARWELRGASVPREEAWGDYLITI